MNLEPWHLAVAVAAVVLTAIGMGCGAAIFLWRAASYATRIEVAAAGVAEVKVLLQRIPAIEQHLEFQDARLERIEKRTDSAYAHAMRAEVASQHDGE